MGFLSGVVHFFTVGFFISLITLKTFLKDQRLCCLWTLYFHPESLSLATSIFQQVAGL